MRLQLRNVENGHTMSKRRWTNPSLQENPPPLANPTQNSYPPTWKLSPQLKCKPYSISLWFTMKVRLMVCLHKTKFLFLFGAFSDTLLPIFWSGILSNNLNLWKQNLLHVRYSVPNSNVFCANSVPKTKNSKCQKFCAFLPFLCQILYEKTNMYTRNTE